MGISLMTRNGMLAALVCTISVTSAHAAQDITRGVSLGPGLRMETAIQGKAEYTDNKYWTADNEESALGLFLLPELTVNYVQSAGEYSLQYRGEMGEYDTSSRDDYFDHKLSFIGSYSPLTKHRFGLGINYRAEHDDFGTSRTSGITAIDDRELDEWDQIDGVARYTYGAPDATLNWHVRAVFLDKSYDTNRTDPLNPATGTRFLDHTSNGFGGGLAYRISPRTQAILDLERRDIQYDVDSVASFDGTRQQALIGLRWEATAKTSGEFLIGSFSRDFDDAAREDVSGASWRGRIFWALKSYSTVIFTTGQETHEQYLQGEDVITEEYLNVDWRHDWTTTVHSEISIGLHDQVYEGIGRSDDVMKWYAGLDVDMAPRYLLTFGYRYIDRESNLNNFDFNRGALQLGVKATF